MKTKFQIRWKEELIGTLEDKQFTVERTMGILTVYFPTASKWEALAPNWAKGKWEQVKSDLTEWCQKENAPLVVDENAWINFDKD